MPIPIVTGSEEALRQLVARGGDAELASGPMELLLKKLSPGGDLAVMVDLSPPRTAGRGRCRPTCWMSGRPANRGGTCSARPRWPWGFRSNRPTSGDASWGWSATVRRRPKRSALEVEKLVPDCDPGLARAHRRAEGLLATKKFSGQAADQYERLLDDLLAALRTARCDTADGIAWLRFGWGGPGLLVSAATAIECKSARDADWLAAARTVDENNHRGLLGGLLSFAKRQTPPRFPEGRAGGAPMLEPRDPPELDRGDPALSRSPRLARRARLRLERLP